MCIRVFLQLDTCELRNTEHLGGEMARLTVVAEPFPDWEAPVQRLAARDLTVALSAHAPRSCSVRYLSASDSPLPEFPSARIATEQLPLRKNLLPMLWQSRATARPLDGELFHALTPMVPLRARAEDFGTQSTITIPHMLQWEAPELMSPNQARLLRAFVRRAAKFADVILTTTYATANTLAEVCGSDLNVQVVPFAAPREFVAGPDAATLRAQLDLPERYAVTTARADERGRLSWAFDALRAHPEAEHLVVLEGLDPAVYTKSSGAEKSRPAKSAGTDEAAAPEAPRAGSVAVPADLAHRVTVVSIDTEDELAYVGAIIGGASLFMQPQSFLGSGYTVLAALTAGVPVLHSGHDATEELVLEAGSAAPTAEEFAAEFARLCTNSNDALEHLTVLAGDRGRTFSWQNTAWHLWQTHADI